MASNKTSKITSSKLPPELILEIFSRLPSKSLQRLRCILDDDFPTYAKTLDTLEFQHEHAFKELNKVTNACVIVEYNSSRNVMHEFDPPSNVDDQLTLSNTRTHDFEQIFHDILPFKSNKELFGHSVIGASNGLICLYYEFDQLSNTPEIDVCCDNCTRMAYRESYHYFILWNPCTRVHHIIPTPSGFEFIMFDFVGVIPTICGFGYDVINKTYKLVLGEGPITQIYDLSTDKWKLSDTVGIDWDEFDEHFNTFYSRLSKPQFGYYLNGALHWVASNKRIVAINLSTEASSTINLPNCCSRTSHRLNMGVFKGCLSISCYNYNRKKVSIWVMKEYSHEESWTNVLTVKLRESDMCPGPMDIMVVRPPLWVSKDDENEMLFLFEGKLTYCNPKDNLFRYFKCPKLDTHFRGIVHFDTLVSPKPEVYRLGVDDNRNDDSHIVALATIAAS